MKSNKQFKKCKGRTIQLLLFTLFFFSAYTAYAQVNVTGKVVDITGEELIGVNVIIKGTSQGTVTDIVERGMREANVIR